MIRPDDVVDEIRRCRDHSKEPVHFHWIAVTEECEPSSREAFAAELRRLASGEPVCATILRQPGFTDPNAVMNDLADVLAEVQDDVCQPQLQRTVQTAGSLDVILLSRRRFKLSISSSPLQLPEWFPVVPGTIVNASVTDRTLRTGVSLSAPGLGTGELHRLLYELDCGLLAGVRAGLTADPPRVNALLDRLWERPAGSPTFSEIVDGVAQELASIKNPKDYRPSTVKSPTLVGQLWRVANAQSADRLVKVAESLAQAIHLQPAEAADYPETLLTVLARPTRRFPNVGTRWAYNVIVTVQSACQLVTAAAHADDYGQYSAWLLRSLSLDLRRSLDHAVEVVGVRAAS